MRSNFNVKIDPYVLEKIDKIDYYNHIIKTGGRLYRLKRYIFHLFINLICCFIMCRICALTLYFFILLLIRCW